MKNTNLHKAKTAKNDEFYTQYEDIEKEVIHYKEQLKDKWIYCPCDDYRKSNFWKFFYSHFNEYQLKRLTSTNYDLGDGAYRADYDGKELTVNKLEGNGDFRSEECAKIKNQSDLIITNPPFSLFREFVAWIQEEEK